MEESNKVPKIGIFGWTGTGKTIYISMLHYLLTLNKHPYVIGSHVNSTEIEENISFFLSENWNTVTERIKGTKNKSEITFTLKTNDGLKSFIIEDYVGEKIAKDKTDEDLYNYFLKCSALLFFLDAEAFEDNDKLANWKRWDEFQELLHKLFLQNKSQKVKIPIYLVITKKDILTFNDKGEIEMSSSTIEKTYNEKLRVISEYCESTKPFFISSKLCFDSYVKDDIKDIEDLISFCAPVLLSLREIEINQTNQQRINNEQKKREKEEEQRKEQSKQEERKRKFINKILIKLSIGIGILGLIYSLFYFHYNNNLVQIESNGSNIESLKRFKAETPLSFFPTLKTRVNELLNGKSKTLLKKIRNHAKKIREYDTTLKLINEYKEKNFTYDEKEFHRIKVNIQAYLIKEIENHSILDSKRLLLLDDFNKYFNTNESKSNLSNNLLKKINKINEDAKIIQKIQESSSYATVIPLCKKHNRLNTGYFDDISIPLCETAHENKKIAHENLEKEQLRLQAERANSNGKRLKEELDRERSKSAWDKFWE